MSLMDVDFMTAYAPQLDMEWLLVNHAGPEDLGLLVTFLDNNNPDKATTQLDYNYSHGGGWRKMGGFALHYTSLRELMAGLTELRYGEGDDADPPYRIKAATVLHDNEMVLLFDYGWCAVMQTDGAVEVARLD